MCKVVKLVLALIMGAHFWHIKKLLSSQETFERLTGKKDDKKCRKEKKVVAVVSQPVQQQPVYYQQPIVEYSVNAEAPDIHEERDKEMGITFAPTASTITVNNQMV